jgi:hypothetical protein
MDHVQALKPVMITNIGMQGRLTGIFPNNPIVIVIAVLALIAYFGGWRRRL